MEAELIAQHASQQLRLARYREVYYEAIWIELGVVTMLILIEEG